MPRFVDLRFLIIPMLGVSCCCPDDGKMGTNANKEVMATPKDEDQVLDPTVHFTYGPGLAAKFGLEAGEAVEVLAPVLGAAIELKPIGQGRVCLVHVLYESGADVRLPEPHEMMPIGPNVEQLPNRFLKRPDHDIRKFIGRQIGELANRAVVRLGREAFTQSVKITEDKRASYTAMPLNGYRREFVPGVAWLVTSVNCELFRGADPDYVSVLLEKKTAPNNLIAELVIDPGQMTELLIPPDLVRRAQAAYGEPGGPP